MSKIVLVRMASNDVQHSTLIQYFYFILVINIFGVREKTVIAECR